MGDACAAAGAPGTGGCPEATGTFSFIRSSCGLTYGFFCRLSAFSPVVPELFVSLSFTAMIDAPPYITTPDSEVQYFSEAAAAKLFGGVLTQNWYDEPLKNRLEWRGSCIPRENLFISPF